MKYKLSLELIEPQERGFIQESLVEIQDKLNYPWELVDAAPAHVVLIDTDKIDSKNFLDACKNCVGSIPLAYGHENHLNSHFFLHQPLSLTNFLVCLNELSAYLKQRSSEIDANHFLFKQVEHLNPDQGLLGMVLRAQQLQQPVKLKLNDKMLLSVHGEMDCCHLETCTLGQRYSPLILTELITLPIEQMQLIPLEPQEYQTICQDPHFCCYSLKTLIWSFSLLVSHGSLLVTIDPNKKFSLSSTPDFSQLPHLPCHAQLAYYMREFQSDLMTIVKNTRTPYTRVIDFINACFLTGILLLDDTQSNDEVKKPYIPSFAREKSY